MKITKDDLRYVARLARIELTDREVASFTPQLGKVLEYMDKLNKLNTANVEPTSHVLPLRNIYRLDKMTPSLKQNEVLRCAPDKHKDFFKVPRVIEGA